MARNNFGAAIGDALQVFGGVLGQTQALQRRQQEEQAAAAAAEREKQINLIAGLPNAQSIPELNSMETEAGLRGFQTGGMGGQRRQELQQEITAEQRASARSFLDNLLQRQNAGEPLNEIIAGSPNATIDELTPGFTQDERDQEKLEALQRQTRVGMEAQREEDIAAAVAREDIIGESLSPEAKNLAEVQIKSADREMAANGFDPLSDEDKDDIRRSFVLAEAVARGDVDPTDVRALRSDWTRDTADFRDIYQRYNQILIALENPGPGTDIIIFNNLVRLTDPGNRVTQGEADVVLGILGLKDKVDLFFQRQLAGTPMSEREIGDLLSDVGRDELSKAAKAIVASTLPFFGQIRDSFIETGRLSKIPSQSSPILFPNLPELLLRNVPDPEADAIGSPRQDAKPGSALERLREMGGGGINRSGRGRGGR